MKTYNIEQKTEEWFKARSKKMTASNAQAISAQGKGLETYILELLSSHYSTAEREIYTNENIERGNELEEYARNMYELTQNVKVEEVGFIELDEYVGMSPDGLIGEDGLIEIKSVNDKNHFKIIIDKEIESKYIWQMQMQMYVSNRKWCDYVSYNPNFKQSLLIIRVERDEDKIKKIKDGIEKGKKLIEELDKKFNNA